MAHFFGDRKSFLEWATFRQGAVESWNIPHIGSIVWWMMFLLFLIKNNSIRQVYPHWGNDLHIAQWSQNLYKIFWWDWQVVFCWNWCKVSLIKPKIGIRLLVWSDMYCTKIVLRFNDFIESCFKKKKGKKIINLKNPVNNSNAT